MRRAAPAAGPAAPGASGRPVGAAPAAAVGLGATLLVFALGWGRAFGIGDEGFMFLLADAWAAGEPLFARWEVRYPPGQYVWLGSWLAVFGRHLEVLRLAAACFSGAAAALVFAALAPWTGRAPAAAAAFAGAVAGVASAATPASALVLAAALRLARPEAVPVRRLAALGAGAGLLVGWREDSAVLLGTVVLSAAVLGRAPTGGRSDLAKRLVLPVLAAGAGVLAWVAVGALGGEAGAWAAHLGRRLLFLGERVADGGPGFPRPPGGLEALLAGGAPVTPRRLALALLPLALVVPPLLYGGLLADQLRRRLRRGPVDPALVAAALAGATYLPQIFLERPDLPHLRAHLHLFAAVAVLAAVRLPAPARRARRGVAVAAAVAAATLAAAAGLVAQHRAADAAPYPCCGGRAIGAHLEDGTPPWSGLPGRAGDTMIVVGWGPGWYLLEDLSPGTRILVADRTADERAAARLAADLAHPANRWALVTPTSAPPAALEVLRRHYRRRAAWAYWELWEREG